MIFRLLPYITWIKIVLKIQFPILIEFPQKLIIWLLYNYWYNSAEKIAIQYFCAELEMQSYFIVWSTMMNSEGIYFLSQEIGDADPLP